MATAKNQAQIDDDEYSKAFMEEQAGPAQMTDDEAFSGMGMGMDDESGTPSAEADSAVVVIEGDGAPEGEAMQEDEAMAGMQEGMDSMVAPAADEDEEPTDPKEIQQKKSWEGRLKAREENLRMREEALAGADMTGAAKSAESGEVGDAPAEAMDQAGDAVVDMAAAVSAGEMTAEQAMKTLEEDFGPEFVQMLSVLVNDKAAKAMDTRVGEVRKTVDELISDLVNDKARTHFETVAEAHPDFAEINGSEALTAYLAELPEADRTAAEQVAESGNARQIVKMLDAFKAWAKEQLKAKKAASGDDMDMDMDMDMGGGIDESAADAAEGVRSTGLALPGAPDKDDSYEAAWSKF
jgi:hypothetical protein